MHDLKQTPPHEQRRTMLKRILTPLAIIISLSTTTPALAAQKPTEAFRCPKAMRIALTVGFHKKDLPTLDKIVYRESRCQPTSIGINRNKKGGVRSRDWGLVQINDASWLRYLRDRGIIETRKNLLNPKTNMVAAKALYDYSVSRGYNQWIQWRTA